VLLHEVLDKIKEILDVPLNLLSLVFVLEELA
jgi:hypothetical protein